VLLQADDGAQPKKRSFRKFSYRGVDLEHLLELKLDDLLDRFHARARRKCVFPWRCLVLFGPTWLRGPQAPFALPLFCAQPLSRVT
jgi:hypothetical protein